MQRPRSTHKSGRKPSFSRLRAILYGWSDSDPFRRAKALLEDLGIPHREVVLDGRQEAARHLQEIFGCHEAPLTLLDGRMLFGLDALERALRRS